MAVPDRVVIRRGGLWRLQDALHRKGLGPVAGVDEVGRGACAGPLVVAACVLRVSDGKRLSELTDSKQLTEPARERVYERVRERALDYAIVSVPPGEIDSLGVHNVNIEGMRRAVARLDTAVGYVLTDAFAVPGLAASSVPVRKGDQSAACVAAASVLAKVTRDRYMCRVHERFPQYGFVTNKGYSTAGHSTALNEHGPCELHRYSYGNVAAAAAAHRGDIDGGEPAADAEGTG